MINKHILIVQYHYMIAVPTSNDTPLVYNTNILVGPLAIPTPEPFDTIVSVSKVRYFRQKVSYQYRIGIVIPGSGKYQYSISIRIF